MGELILYIASSLDGYIAGEGGEISWLDRFQDEQEDYGYGALIERIGALIMGGKTYRQVLGFGPWPYSGIRTYGVSRQDLVDPPVSEIRQFHGDVSDLMDRIRAESEKDIWLVGGAELVAQFVNQDLVDEYIISVMPVLLGKGIALFQGIDRTDGLSLVDSISFPSGVVQIHYRKASSPTKRRSL